MNRKKGFTLVEIIIVIAVIAILAAILIPVISNMIEKSNAKSALSDAKNVITAFIAHIQNKEAVEIPDTVVAVHKGSHLYIFAYSKEKSELLVCNSNPFKYANSRANVRKNAAPVLGQLESEGVLTAREEPIYSQAYLDNFINGAGYTVNQLALYTDYYIDAEGFTTVEKFDITDLAAANITDDPVTRKILPVFDTANEIYTYTINQEDVDALGSNPESKIELDTREIMQIFYLRATDLDANFNWGGYGIKVVNNSDMDYSSYKVKFESSKISGVMNGSTLTSDLYPLITDSTAFKNYMSSIGYNTVNEANVNSYISKANSGTLSQTYTQYLTATYGESIPTNKIAEVCKGETVGNKKHVEAGAAKMIFDAMYDNGYVFAFVSSATQANTAYNNSRSMTDGWKTSGSVNFYSVYDLIAEEKTVSISGTELIMFSWHENAVPKGNLFIDSDIERFQNQNILRIYLEP